MAVVDKKYDVAAASRYARPLKVSTFQGEEFLEELFRLSEGMADRGIVICADERPLLTLSKYRDRLAGSFSFRLPPHRLLVDLTLKATFFHLAQQRGFPVPLTLLLREYGDLDRLGELKPPLCVKPNGRSVTYDGSFKKAYRVDTGADARLLCEKVLSTVGEVIVQEWIEGSNDSIYFCLCYMRPCNSVAFTGRKGRSWPPQTGVTASCWAAPEVADELEALTISFFRAIGMDTGFASMEYKRDERDGSWRFIEPTVGRIDGQVEISALCGVNLCHFGYCDAAGQPPPALKLDPTHVWRDEFRDCVSARLLKMGCSYPPRFRIHNAYWRRDDPNPALLELARVAKHAMRRENW